MKIPVKNKIKKAKIKENSITKNKKEQLLVVAQEFKFARLLSGNEKKTRDRVLKTLKKWLQNCFDKGYDFKEDDFIRVWKGLFYAVWMSDKPLVQEDLCESIAEILDQFPLERLKHAIVMTKAGLKVLAMEWYGIDQHRMDKFLMLVRRYLRGSLRCLLRSNWSLQSCQMYSKMLMDSDGILCVKTPQYARNATSMIIHMVDCYLEELAKVSKGEIPEESLAALLYPFTSLVCGGEALVLCVAARRLLTMLLRQSEQGLQYQEATRAWQKMGCPAGGPEALELESEGEEESEHADDELKDEQPSALDPRAGRVNVFLPLLPVPARLLAEQLRSLMTKASSKAYKRASICLKRFEALSKDEYPLVIPEVDASGTESPTPLEDPAEALGSLEKQLVKQSDELSLRGLKRKHRKRLLAKSRAGLSIIEDVPQLKDRQINSTNGDWHIEDTGSDLTKKDKTNSSNKENEGKRKKTNRKRKIQENGNVKVKKAKNEENKANSIKKSDKNQINTKIEKQVEGNKKKDLVNGKNIKAKNKVDGKNVNKKQDNPKKLPKLIEINIEKKKKDNLKPISNISVNNEIKKADNSQKQLTEANGHVTPSKIVTKRQKVLPMNKIKNYQKQTSSRSTSNSNRESTKKNIVDTQKKVKFALKNNIMQETVDYYKSVRQSPNIPFDSSKKPSKTNLKPSTPSPINPFFKKKLKLKF